MHFIFNKCPTTVSNLALNEIKQITVRWDIFFILSLTNNSLFSSSPKCYLLYKSIWEERRELRKGERREARERKAKGRKRMGRDGKKGEVGKG